MITTINEFRKLNENFDDSNLSGDDKKIYDAVNNMCDDLFEYEFFERWSTINRIDPIITSIIDQNKNGGTGDFPEDKQFFVFINNRDGNGYKELEAGIEYNGYNNLKFVNPEQSSHGWPASYGKEMYSFDRKTGKMEYDREFFKYILG